MHSDQTTGVCSAAVGSLTQALQAQSVLAAAAVKSDVVKADTVGGRRGCAYALSYSCEQETLVRRLLKSAGIRIRK